MTRALSNAISFASVRSFLAVNHVDVAKTATNINEMVTMIFDWMEVVTIWGITGALDIELTTARQHGHTLYPSSPLSAWQIQFFKAASLYLQTHATYSKG
jgi:hypothetical protein